MFKCQHGHVSVNFLQAGYYYEGCIRCGFLKAMKVDATLDGGRKLRLANKRIVFRPWTPQSLMKPFPEAAIIAIKVEWSPQKVKEIMKELIEK